ncbi:OmpH family outer membrane protein [Polaribacter sp.]|nr:OmpH family outer membrane protein [Polaribacter sp.]
MKKTFLLTFLCFTIGSSWSQRGQIIAYMDMEYILENVPEYLEAQNTLDKKVVKWRDKLDKEARFIEVLKSDLANEKIILTKDLIEEKEEEITIKQEQLRRLESLYFGPNGDLFSLRKQLVKPIQDRVYNAIQTIAEKKRYDFVFDKSSELVLLYSNKKYDISELILRAIDRTRSLEEKRAAQEEETAPKELNAQQQQLLEKKEAAAAEKLATKVAQRKAYEEKRKALIEERDAKRTLLREKKEALKKEKEEKKQNENN